MWTNCTSVKDRLDNNETTILSYIRVVDSITVLCRDHLSLEVLKNLLVSFYVSVFVKMYICFFFLTGHALEIWLLYVFYRKKKSRELLNGLNASESKRIEMSRQ